MKVLLISFSDLLGGAARATYRIHRSLLSANVDSRMFVVKKFSHDQTVCSPYSFGSRLCLRLRSGLSSTISSLVHTSDISPLSLSLFPSFLSSVINRTSADIVHLHWVQSEMLSISDISRIKKPIVWTFHDMWPFCGAEHYSTTERFIDGYTPLNSSLEDDRLDLNRYVWYSKHNRWRNDFQIVCPSRWLSKLAVQSKLMRNCNVKTIPNPIDTCTWFPVDKIEARKRLGLPLESLLLTFGSMGCAEKWRKGFDLLISSLQHVKSLSLSPSIRIVIFGISNTDMLNDLGFPVHDIGCVNNDIMLRDIYSASDALLIPSRLDNLPNIGLEAHACGLPIVGFNVAGLPDIVKHMYSGYLACPYSTSDFAAGVSWVLELSRSPRLSCNARRRAVSLWSPSQVAKKYMSVYQSVLSSG